MYHSSPVFARFKRFGDKKYWGRFICITDRHTRSAMC